MAGLTRRHAAAAETAEPPAAGDEPELPEFATARAAAAAATATATARRRPARPGQRASSLLPRELVSEHYRDPFILHCE